jgi:AsmA protein
MPKYLKYILFSVSGLIGFIILICVALFIFVDTSAYKARLEKAASEALGMEVHVGGQLKIAFFSDLHVHLEDVHIRNREMDIVSAKEASLEIALLPLLHKEVRIRKIGLKHSVVSITRDRHGVFNFEKKKESQKTFLTLDIDNISLSDGAFHYKDEQSTGKFEMENINLNMHSMRIAGWNSKELLKTLSFTAEFACKEIRTGSLIFSDVKFTGKGKDGVIALHPITMRLFSGQGSGSIGIDFSNSVPRYSVRSSLSKFRVEEYFKTISAKKVAAGLMDFSANLSMHGNTLKEIRQTSHGEATLRGENLTLYGSDLDREFARYESSQNFNLVDIGAFFFVGPLGLVVTKGYNFATIFRGSGESSTISTLFSDWKVEHGIAEARDVAMATQKNRIALHGRINFVDESFDDVTVALIDARGCARVKQIIHGPFQKPVVEKPNVLISVAGPVLNLIRRARNIFTGNKCELFYTGSVPAPQ